MSHEIFHCPTLPDVVVYESMHGSMLGSMLDSVTRSLIHTESVKEL